MRWVLLSALATMVVVHRTHGEDLVLVGGSSGDAYDLRQVRQAETDARACQRDRQQRSSNSRLEELMTQRRCALYHEIAREKRRIYEQRKRIAKQREDF
jgi:hypothetical protein